MGAYYTKEDITEYIGKNCILPFLLDEVKKTTSERDFQPDGYVWRTLRESGDRYIYDAVKHGHTDDWQQQIPAEIAQGIDTTKPDLLERRAQWNKPATEPFALPTEIWRETVERLQRCDSLLEQIAQGKVTQTADLITLNLDIRELCYDLLAQTDDHLFVEHFYHAMQQVTILDPTCGSGAFLFAAMNILEPLYDLCITRMEDFQAHNPNLFKAELDEINSKYRSNRQYFIYKSIILRNLYGVDIMAEAVEIAKLRLFLKMVAVVDVNRNDDDNLGLDPLPDIDFNIRCGNTLVGYATEKELDDDLTYGDMFARDEFKEKIDVQMDAVARIYSQFKRLQLTAQEDYATFHEAKLALRKRLARLNQLLNHKMYASEASGGALTYEAWLCSHQPFHWLAEFYQIMQGNGGFDVIIGNPPYIETSKVRKQYSIANYSTVDSGNIYACVLERCYYISRSNAKVGWIVPVSIVSTDRTSSIQKFIREHFGCNVSTFDIFPSRLFDGAAQRVAILLLQKGIADFFVTKYYRWKQSERGFLFANLKYVNNDRFSTIGWTARINNSIQLHILDKLSNQKQLGTFLYPTFGTTLYVHRIINNFIKAVDFEPYFKKGDGTITHTDDFKLLVVRNTDKAAMLAILNSNLFYWYWRCHGDGFHCGFKDIEKMPISLDSLSKCDTSLQKLVKQLMRDLDKWSEIRTRNQKTTGLVELQTFFVGKSKSILDQIDTLLAKHYGFTDEELDFIINYDIKYRMGDELNSEE